MKTLVALVLALPLAAAAQAPHPPSPADPPRPQGYPPAAAEKVRDSWYIGFGLGSGNGSASGQGSSSSFEELGFEDPTTVFMNFRVGATLSPRLLLGGEIQGIASVAEQTLFGTKLESSVGIGAWNAVVTFFPMERGLYLRGGLGIARYSESAEGGGEKYEYRVRGGNALVGIGYAWWLGRAFNLSANLDFAQQWYGDSDVDVEASRYWALYLGFDWY